MSTTRTAVITIVSGRHSHLRNQQRGLLEGFRLPDDYVVVSMGDPAALRNTESGPLAGTATQMYPVLLPSQERMPLALARNTGAAAALRAGADTLVFLDVDCVPSAPLVQRYTESVAAATEPALHCGVVRYLPSDVHASAVELSSLTGPPHAARPVPAPGERIINRDWALFWSLSFAIKAADWVALGGFCEDYQGYGAEDTDLGYRAFNAGLPMQWIGGADAFHQYHDVERPPIQHLHDIVDNATVFHRRWGFWPMLGWLEAFADLGLARFDPDLDTWSLTAAGAELRVAASLDSATT
jgi:N-acetylglucosaminyl-diphospho-decaprenol L-rhamnosyltransferase